MSTKRVILLPHRLKGRILDTLNASNDAPGILLREKSFRHNDEEIDIHADREQETGRIIGGIQGVQIRPFRRCGKGLRAS